MSWKSLLDHYNVPEDSPLRAAREPLVCEFVAFAREQKLTDYGVISALSEVSGWEVGSSFIVSGESATEEVTPPADAVNDERTEEIRDAYAERIAKEALQAAGSAFAWQSIPAASAYLIARACAQRGMAYILDFEQEQS